MKFHLISILIAFFVFTACNRDDEIRILFTGDILLSRNVRVEYQHRSASPWIHIKSLFQQADLVVGNLEGAIGDTVHTSSLLFDINPNDIPMLREAGFNIITIANNHSCDLGEVGFEKTIETLIANEIRPVGYDLSPQFFTVKGVVISIVAINTVPSGRDGSVNQVPSVETMQKLRLARTLSNVVIVSIHWGSELLEWTNKNQRVMAEWLIENGADVIIGSHPHVVQQPEIINGKPVFFSLGNHLFDQKYPATKEGLIADIRIRRGKIYCKGIVTHTAERSFFPETTAQIDYSFRPVRTGDLFSIGAYTLLPVSLFGHHKYNLMFNAHSNGKRTWSTPPMSVVSLNRAKFDDEPESLFILERHYSNMDGETGLRPYVYGVDDRGIHARWRGSALAWPIIDAQIMPCDNKTLCALHRGDSFINIDQTAENTRIMTYQWNGFGFSGKTDSDICEGCWKLYE